MDPVTAIMGIQALVGLGTSMFGSSQASSANQQAAQLSSQYYGLSQDISKLQMQENYNQYLAMMYQSQASEMQNLRNVQKTLATISNNQANQGGAGRQSSALGAGLGGGVAAGARNTENILQGVATGTKAYQLTNMQSIYQYAQSGVQSQISTAQGNVASAQGIQQLGAGITSAAGPFAKFGGSFIGGGQSDIGGTGLSGSPWQFNFG